MKLFNYAYKLILSRFVNTAFNEIYSAVVGAFYTPAQLGLFNRAKNFETMTSINITTIVQRVSTPILCEKQKDHYELGQSLIYFIRNTSFFVFPLLCGLLVLADPLIRVLLTDKWEGAIWILQVLCPVGMLYVFSTFNLNIFNATGRTDWALKCETIKKVVDIAIIICAVRISFQALVWSQVVIAVFEFFINLFYTKKQIGLGLIEQLKSVLGIFVCSAVMAVVVFCVASLMMSDVVKLFVGIVVGVLTYVILCLLINVNNSRTLVKKILSR